VLGGSLSDRPAQAGLDEGHPFLAHQDGHHHGARALRVVGVHAVQFGDRLCIEGCRLKEAHGGRCREAQGGDGADGGNRRGGADCRAGCRDGPKVVAFQEFRDLGGGCRGVAPVHPPQVRQDEGPLDVDRLFDAAVDARLGISLAVEEGAVRGFGGRIETAVGQWIHSHEFLSQPVIRQGWQVPTV
jgi:hypothetical protein